MSLPGGAAFTDAPHRSLSAGSGGLPASIGATYTANTAMVHGLRLACGDGGQVPGLPTRHRTVGGQSSYLPNDGSTHINFGGYLVAFPGCTRLYAR